MKKSTKIVVGFAVLLVVVGAFMFASGGKRIHWFHVSEGQVASIEVRSGLTGEAFTLDTPEEIGAVTELLNGVGVQTGTSVDHSVNGYWYILTVRNGSGKTVGEFTVVESQLLAWDDYCFHTDISDLISYLESVDPSV